MHESAHTNALAGETSPYLLQHAHNPVAWYPWGETALKKARDEDKPILLSIGYSACHWCHVMAHESFEDEETAALMNRYFVNIKVDREERPDIDKIYQTAQQILTRRNGGWPLTMFLTPGDHLPFFGGTYFPPESRYGMPGFRELLVRVAQFYTQEQDGIRQQNASMMEALRSLERPPAPEGEFRPGPEPLHLAVDELHNAFDQREGGFGGAPKFPHPANLELLLAYQEFARGPDARRSDLALDMLRLSLEKMADGGIHDQLGGGFSRYAVDDHWMIPHFEKMLYDNGPLLALYSDAWRLTGETRFRDVADGIAAWVMREMQSPEGGYYSSLDADSEGEEGKYYVWTADEPKKLLSTDEYAALSRRFSLDRPANFEGHWHLYVSQSEEQVAENTSRSVEQVRALLQSARAKLLAAREKRVHPGRDDKILTAWNGLMIRGMAVAALGTGRQDYFHSAERALEFLRATLWNGERLLATCKDGHAHLNAYLDDYALLLHALLDMLACRWKPEWLDFAIRLAEVLLQDFQDTNGGGFYFTSHGHETLIQRRKDFTDDAIPSGNGMAAWALIRLGHLLGEQRYLDVAEGTLRAGWTSLLRLPHAHDAMLLALMALVAPPRQIVLRGSAPELDTWHRKCLAAAGPRTRIYAIPRDAPNLPGLLAERNARDGNVAYICEGFSCREPVTQFDELASILGTGDGP